jgi:hypothetical protein
MLILQGEGGWGLNFCFTSSVINLSSNKATLLPGGEKDSPPGAVWLFLPVAEDCLARRDHRLRENGHKSVCVGGCVVHSERVCVVCVYLWGVKWHDMQICVTG